MALLSGKPFDEYTPESFKSHVRSLYAKREARKSRSAKPKAAAVKWKLTPKGNLTVAVKRNPKWISPKERAEIEAFATANGIKLNDTFLTFKRLKIQVLSEIEALEIAKRMVEVG